MKVSVVMPLYNKAAWVRRALDSISAQTFADFEVIVVDDGSTDESAQGVRQHPDPRIRLIQQANAGPGAARNRGIAEARGELVAFLDADDEWLPQFLERSVAALEAAGPEVGATVCGYYEHPSGVSGERRWRRRGIREGIFVPDPGVGALRLMHCLAYMNPWATVARKAVLDRHGGFFARTRCLYGEDSFLWLKVLLNEQVLFRTEPLVRFHTEASALSGNYRRARQVEPFLLHPEELEASCPRTLRPLLRELLSIRASKTACMLSYWGRREEAEALLWRFERDRAALQPWAPVARLASTRVGVALGAALRGILGRPAPEQAAVAEAKSAPKQAVVIEPGAPLPLNPEPGASRTERRPRQRRIAPSSLPLQ